MIAAADGASVDRGDYRFAAIADRVSGIEQFGKMDTVRARAFGQMLFYLATLVEVGVARAGENNNAD